jgi:tetratricopeptide (TPR) repeat protein
MAPKIKSVIMPNRKVLRKQKQAAASQPSNLDRLQDQLQTLIQKKNYRQAIEKAKNIKKMHPEAEIKPSEAEIWELQGFQEYSQGQHRQAQTSLEHAVALGGREEAYYWLTKSMLATGNSATALETMRSAFENKVLTTEYAGCYLKLLFLQGAADEVAELLKTQTKRFSATQINWAKGVLAVQAGNLPTALGHFQKMKGEATPSDAPAAWIAYTHQQLGNWEKAESALNIPKRSNFSTPPPTHPAIGRLGMMQAISPIRSATTAIPINPQQGKQRTLSLILRLLQLLAESDYHNAAHILQKIPHPCLDFPEVDALHRSLMLLATEQSIEAESLNCATAFLEATVYQPPFDLQLVLKLRFLYREEDADIQDMKRLLNYLITEVKQVAKTYPQNWPASRLNSTLAHIHCWLTDAWISNGYQAQGYKTLQLAEQLCPESPEVLGRKGLKFYLQGNGTQAVSVLTNALEAGCRYEEVYVRLLMELKSQGNYDGVKDIRRRFGKFFDDVDVDDEVEIPKWIGALSTKEYQFFAQLVADQKTSDTALKACQIFVATVEGKPNTTGKVDFNQEQAQQQWEKLLETVAGSEQIQAIQAIFLAVQLFAKRQKGIVALQNAYLQRLLMIESPAAQLAHLMLWAVKGDRAQQMQTAIRSYLSISPQPGNALAQLQFNVRYYVQTDTLRSLIDEFLRQDSQNPQLLLAKATTYPNNSKNYTELQEQSFDLARRLQDVVALQAHREEKALQATIRSHKMTALFSDSMDEDDFERLNIAKKMISNMFGDDLPPGALEKMLPELMRMLEEDLLDEDDFFEDDDDFFDFGSRPLFGGTPVRPPQKPPKRPSNKKKRK